MKFIFDFLLHNEYLIIIIVVIVIYLFNNKSHENFTYHNITPYQENTNTESTKLEKNWPIRERTTTAHINNIKNPLLNRPTTKYEKGTGNIIGRQTYSSLPILTNILETQNNKKNLERKVKLAKDNTIFLTTEAREKVQKYVDAKYANEYNDIIKIYKDEARLALERSDIAKNIEEKLISEYQKTENDIAMDTSKCVKGINEITCYSDLQNSYKTNEMNEKNNKAKLAAEETQQIIESHLGKYKSIKDLKLYACVDKPNIKLPIPKNTFGLINKKPAWPYCDNIINEYNDFKSLRPHSSAMKYN